MAAAAHLAAVAASCALHKATVAPVEGCVYTQLLASLRAGKGAPCLVHLEEDGALVAWEAEGQPRVLVDGDLFFSAHALCGTLQRTAGCARHGAGVSAAVFKLLERGLSYSGALQCALREEERRVLLGSAHGGVPWRERLGASL